MPAMRAMAMDMAAMMPRRMPAAVMAMHVMMAMVVTLGAMMVAGPGRGRRREGDDHRRDQGQHHITN